MTEIKRGSEWKRWELHLHTPFTKKEDQYIGSTPEEKWDNFYATIANYIGDGSDPLHSICAIAVTDYLSIDNYLKVCNDGKLPDSVKLIFPNVELRMKPVASESPINIHCLFDPDVAGELENRFFANLKFEYNQNQYGATKSELIRLGRDFSGGSAISEHEALATGLAQYVISFEALSHVFKQNPQLREKVIIVVSNKSNDGVSGLRAHSDYFDGSVSQLEATRRSIYQFSDMIFSSNAKDILYFLGEGVDNAEAVKEKCGCLMPCVHGCDAHTNDRVFSPDGDKFCWIKAEPTFEGLKQVLYEPKERVRICSTVPDERPSYYLIDRVEIDNSTEFSPTPIYFSDKLTCIIGGKSTGKSLLLHNMAMAIDEKQVKKKQETAVTNVKRIPELRVFWRDGACSSDKESQRRIVYIPQTYLNRLSDEEQETTEIDTIIQDIVLQDSDCLNAYQILDKEIAEKKQELAKLIVDFLKTVSDKQMIFEQCKEIGDEAAIGNEIQKLTAQLDQLSKEYNVTETEVITYQSSVEKIHSLKEELVIISKESETIKDITSIVEVDSLMNCGISIFADSIKEAVSVVKQAADEAWLTQREKILEKARTQQSEKEAAIKEQTETVNALQPKMDGNEQVSKLSAAIMDEKGKLSKLKAHKAKLKVIQDTYAQQLELMSQSFGAFGEIYLRYVKIVNEGFVSSTDDLDFLVKRVFRAEQLTQKVGEILNNKSFSRFKVFDLHKITEDDLTPKNISELISELIESLLTNSSESLQLKSSYSIESGLREILTDWYNIDYVVKMDGDSIQEMSPGKKALVLLRLLISLAESECPILIDQPEDDLDNRSIFDELICFIKEKKTARQIITVTHNANIVLGGDAELVIVANQDGKNSPNERYRFEYRGGAIEDNSPILDGGSFGKGILNRHGMQEHICEILEGGEQAFALRQHKYHFIKH